VRFTPTLAFARDTVPDTANRMEELLARASAADEDLARVRQGAKHAGDEDPYRQDRVEGIDGEPENELDVEDTVDRD
jgi:ribosome-binding factor A